MTTPDQFRELQAALDHQRAGRISDALKICKRLVREAPDSFECIYLLAMLHAEQRDLTAAIEMFRRAAGIRPEFTDAQYNLAVALSMAARHEEAVKCYEQILQANPRHLDARNNYAASLLASGRALDALHQYDQLIALSPASADAYNNRGMVLERLRRFDQALGDYDKAIALRPDFPQACVNRGNVLVGLRRSDDALASYRKAVGLKPDFADAYNNIGNIYCDRGHYEEALEAYNQALALKVDDSEARSMRLYAKMHLCDWSNFKSECSSVTSGIKRGAPVYPFTILAFSSSLDEQFHCARLFSKRYPLSARPLWRGEKYSHDRIRVAYVSTDFRQHAVASILAGMFEDHDKSKFEVTAVSIGPDDGSEMRQRLQRAFEHFVDARQLSDDEIAIRIREAEIDILIDLNGYTAGARFGIFAHRAAPLQVGYLGGTRGADYIDYLIADRTIVTPGQRPYYAEKIIYLPDSFQPIDDKRIVSDNVHSRAELGLPEKGFVFCCFNNSYKIVPRNFDSWMRILKRIDGSVLWLREDKAAASANLRKEAEARGVAGERLVFAQRMPSVEEHLGRHRSADLFLDTLPFNAHTTADDALWAGLPVLTQAGEALPGRVGASLLRAIGLPEMIAGTEEEYERIAIELASDPAKLEAIRAKLTRNRLTTPLFSTALFTRHMEGAYLAIYRRWREGLAPDDVSVARVAVADAATS
jgi:predicted O-linked N-acetylglucosamine transferase (SPINDLY family)